MADRAASPGGLRVSAAKKRRLAALEKSLGGPPQGPQQGGKKPGGAQGGGSRPGGAVQPGREAKRSRAAGQAGAGGRPAQLGAAAQACGAHAAAGSPQEQQQREHPIYGRLGEELSAGPLAEALQLPPPGDGYQAVSQLLEGLLATNPSRGLDARAAIGLKVSDRALLLENPAVTKQGGRRREGERRAAQRLLPHKQQRALGLYDLASAGLTYEQVQPLHQRWRQYIGTLLAGAGASAAGPPRQPSATGGGSVTAAQQGGAGAGSAGTRAEGAALLGADLHGCLLRVAESGEARYRGVEGVVVRDGLRAFVVVTKDDRTVTLPKRACVFEYGLGRGRVVRLLGSNLGAQPQQRHRKR